MTASNSKYQIWEINDPVNINQIVTQYSSNTISFIDSASTVKTYVAVIQTPLPVFLSIEGFEKIENQNIHALGATEYAHYVLTRLSLNRHIDWSSPMMHDGA